MKHEFLPKKFLLSPAIFKKIFLVVTGLIILCCSLSVSAQTLVTIGTATSTTSTSGLSNSTTAGDRNERHMCIYSVAELNTAGITGAKNLLSIAWEKTGLAHYYDKNLTIRIWLKHNAATTFPASPTFATETAAATLVYQSTTDSVPAAVGWMNFNFNTATPFFTWDGVQNLEVITELIRPTDWTNTGFLWRTISTLTNAAANANGTIAAPAATLTRTSIRPQIRLGIPTTGNDAALTGMPNPVSAPAGVQNIDVNLRNTGANTLTNVTISFTIDGGSPVNFPWAGSLLPGAITTVTIGSNSFAGGPHTIATTVSNPNGGADADPANNSFTKNIIVCTPLAGAYTINQTVATGGTNFNSFTDFSSFLTSCGVSGNVTATVTAGSGPYTEQVVFSNITGIGAAATVTIQGSGETITSDTAIIQNNANPGRHIIRLIDLKYFTINNLHIDMFTGSTGFIGIHILNSGNHITISNCVTNMGSATSTLLGAMVANGDPSGILTPGGTFDFLTFTGNTSTWGGYGVSVNGLASPLATNVVISNNNINDFSSNGVYLRETNGASVNGNHFDKSAGASGANAIQLAQAANINGRVFDNFIKMSQTTGSFVGIYLFNGTGHKVYNNLIYDIRSTTGNIEGIRVRTGATAPEIYFNTISFDNPVATTGTLKGFREELSNTGSILRNNIFSITQSSTGLKHAIELAVLTPPTGLISNNNVFWVPGGNIAYRPSSASFPTPLVFPTLASWQAASSQDAASFEVDPFFVSVTNPIPRSAVINNQAFAGTGITTDITGATRSATPDPGAYEFTPPIGDAAITNFILPSIPHCANTLDVKFELTNAGSNTLNSVDINWTVNGVPQTVVNWTGPPLGPGLTTIVTLGNVPVTGNNIYNFSATSSNPNGGTDTNPANDTYTYNGFRRGFEGAITINVSAPATSTNFTSFQSVANALSMYGVCSPITITVLNGSYNEQVVFNTIPGTSAINTVTLNGNNQVLEYNPTVAANDHILQLNAVNYMIVENLRVNSLHATQGRGIHITNGSSKLVIRNNIVNVSIINSTSISFGIIISGSNWLLDGSLSDSVIISGNTVSGGYSAIQLSGVHWTQPLTRISVINNTVLDWYGFGVYLSYTNGCRVSKNIIRRPFRSNSGSDAVTPAGITVPAGSLSFLLEKNRIYDLHSSMPGSTTISRGVYMSGTTTAPTSGTIQNNLIYGMNNDGAQYGIQDNSVTGPVNIYHNTIVLNNATGASTSNTNAINLSNSTAQSGLDMRNNIFVVTRLGTGVKRIIDVAATSAPFTSNYNVSYLNAPGGTQTFAQVGSTPYNTLLDWQGTGKDLNSISADPLFANPATGNFTPTNFLVDGTLMGTSAVGGITDDILDVVRSANPDAGAFEFLPPPCTSPVGGTANTVSGPFCNSGSGTITATGYSVGFGISYQWQYSNDNFVTNINDMAGQTNPASASTGTITSTTYYRLKVTCSTGPTTAFSNIVTITVTPAPAATIAYTGSPYCTISGTANVSRTGTAGGTYSSTPGLTLNTTTGAVTLGTSTPGTYVVTYTIPASGACPLFTTTTNITIANCVVPCVETFDGVTPPVLPVGWFATTGAGSCVASIPWRTTNAASSSAPNAAFTNDPNCVSDEYLDTRPYAVAATGTNRLSFRNNFNLENTFDGMVLEISINGGSFADIITAGGSFFAGGYTGAISTLFGSPIAGRQAWTGNSGGFITSSVNLPAAANGQNILFRFRRATDASVAAVGVYVDDVYVTQLASIVYAGSPYCSTDLTAPVTRTGATGGTYSAAPAGLTINAATGTVTPNTSTPGTYTVTYTIAAGGGCGAFSTTTTITITQAPNAIIFYLNNPYCSNGGIATVSQFGTPGGTYSSTAGLTINATTGAVTLGTSTPGTYTVTYTIAASGGCGITITTTTITITPAPSATISYAGSPYCSNAGTANVTRTGTAGGTYSSTAGLTINAATGAVTLGTSTAGTYTVTYTIAASGGCATYTTTTTITITALPAATIAYTGSPYCSNAGTATVTRTGTAGGTYTAAPAGLVINAATGDVNLSTSTAGTYTVTYTLAAGGGCAAVTATTTITITTLPAATISYAGNPYCQNAGTATVTRTGTAGGTYSAAPAGLVINAATGDVNLATSTAGTYTVTYTLAAGGGCPAVTATTTITITTLPAATISYAGNPYCQNAGTATVTRTGTAGGTYSAAPAGLTINASTGTVTLATSTPGTYTVTYTIAAGGGCGVVTATTSITVSSLSVAPTAATASSGSVCGPTAVTLSVTGGSLGSGATWRWYSGSCGGTLVGTGATLNLTVSATTTYFVRAEGTCNTTTCASVTVTVNVQPTITLTATSPTSLMPGQTSTLTATVTPANATNTTVWYRNGNPVAGATGLSLVVGVDALGLYTVRTTTTAGCTALSNAVLIKDSASAAGVVWIYPNPNNGQFIVRYYTNAQQLGFVRHVIMYNEAGQRVFDETYPITGPYSSMNVNAKHLAAGVYMVQVTDAFKKEILAT
ncbi:MAG: T9SS type A sorting domain-containing protein, partial [Ferruginibacter sp.]